LSIIPAISQTLGVLINNWTPGNESKT